MKPFLRNFKDIFLQFKTDNPFNNPDAVKDFIDANFDKFKQVSITEDEARDFLVYPRKADSDDDEWIPESFDWMNVYAFEAECDYVGKAVRIDQIQDCVSILRQNKDVEMDFSIIIERLMAAGKTRIVGVLTVMEFILIYGPDDSLKTGTKGKVLFHMPPSFNYSVEILDYENGLKRFGIQPIPFLYSRQPPYSISNGSYSNQSPSHATAMDSLLQKIERSRSCRDFFFVGPPETILSIDNLRILWINSKEKEALGYLNQIITVLHQEGHAIVDELQLTFDTGKLLIHTLKNQDRLPNLVKEMICILFISLANSPNNYLLMSEEQYLENKDEAIKDFISFINDKFKMFLLEYTIDASLPEEMYLNYSVESWKSDPGFMKLLHSVVLPNFLNPSHNFCKSLLIIHNYFEHWIPALLDNDLDKDYGFCTDQEYFMARPYFSAKMPNLKCEFADPLEKYSRT